MRFANLISLLLLIVLLSGITSAQTAQEFGKAWESNHISNKFPSNVRHKDLKLYLKKLKKLGLNAKEIGRSDGNKEIYQLEWGVGKTRVLMWSQMHGNEPTATSALIDLFAYLRKNQKKKKWIRRLHNSITIRAIPMLNPDGADIYKRRNLQNIDINRDAKDLQTPEGQILMRAQNIWQPDIGFNLHNQGELTTAGNTTNQAAIAVLAVGAAPETPVSEGQKRNQRICALIFQDLSKFAYGNISRYGTSYNPVAFGDTFSDLGTPVILIEGGGHHKKGEMFLVKLNFIAFLTALRSIAFGTDRSVDPLIYENIPRNRTGRLHNYIFRNATVIKRVDPDENESGEETGKDSEPVQEYEEYAADVGVNRRRNRAEMLNQRLYISNLGNLASHRGLTEFDVSGYYIVSSNGLIRRGGGGNLLFFKKSRNLDWNDDNLFTNSSADAVFGNGKWVKPLPR